MNSNRLVPCRVVALAALSWLGWTTPAFAQVVPECGGRLPAAARLPDLVNIIPHHIHVQEAKQQHRLMFTTGLGNIGEGPMEVAPASALTDPKVLVTANQNL